jgi:predicted secreted protein
VKRALAAALLGAALAAGCGGDRVKTFKDPHGRIEVDRGKRFAVELRVNSGVGYDWKFVGLPTGIALVQLEKTTIDYPDEDRAGENGTKRFEFRTKDARGIQTISFQRYFRGKRDEHRSVNVAIGGG